MPFCPKCETKLPDGAAWCPIDGTPVRAISHSETIAPDDDAPAGATGQTASYVRGPAGPSPSTGGPSPSTDGPSPSTGGAPVSAAMKALYSEPQEIVPGTIIGEYEVTGRLGQGGMGEVFAAVHPIIGKKVAVKVLSEHVASNREVVRRFVAEARAVNQIGHPNIVDVFAFGQIDDGRQYYVMEHLEGCTLDDELESRGKLPPEEIVALLADTLDALEAAHNAGIIHRDLKPDNIFLCEGRRRVVKLLDFGIAKLTGDDPGMARTRTGMAMGTPEFMSPEQCRGANVDHRTDIYALGIILFRALTGVYPFEGASPIEYFYKHTSEQPPRPSDLTPIPAEFERIILRCLEKEPDDRFGSAAELAAALQEALSEPGEVRGPDPGATTMARGKSGQPPAPGSSTPTEVVNTRGTTNKLVLGIGAAVALALAGGGALYMMGGTESDGAQAAASGAADAAPTKAAAATGADEAADAGSEMASATEEMSEIDAAPEQAVGSIQVNVSVRGASVFVDDEPVAGQGRVFAAEELAPGDHELRVEREGFRPETRSIRVEAGERTDIDVSLRRIPRKREPDRSDRAETGQRDDGAREENKREPVVDKDGTIGLPELMD